MANLEFRRLPCPGKEIAAGLECVELAPKNQADGLEQVVGVVPIADDGEDIGVEIALVTRNQPREQVVILLLVHPR